MGEGAANTARGVWALGTGLVTDFPGVSSRMANGLVALVSGRGPEADIHDEAQGFLYLLQGDEVARARLAAKSSAEFALAMIPAGRAGAVGKAVELAADAKGPATTLLSGETKLVGSSAPAANDASFMGPFVPQLSRYEDRVKLTPINGGSWSGLRGESNFVFDNPELKTILPDGISYKNGYPDFSPVAVQEIRLPGLITTNRDSNFRAANKMLASQLGVKEADVVRFIREQKYTWHEVEDMRTLQLVPSFIHTGKVGPMGFGVKYGHLGGIAERSLLEALKK